MYESHFLMAAYCLEMSPYPDRGLPQPLPVPERFIHSLDFTGDIASDDELEKDDEEEDEWSDMGEDYGDDEGQVEEDEVRTKCTWLMTANGRPDLCSCSPVWSTRPHQSTRSRGLGNGAADSGLADPMGGSPKSSTRRRLHGSSRRIGMQTVPRSRSGLRESNHVKY